MASELDQRITTVTHVVLNIKEYSKHPTTRKLLRMHWNEMNAWTEMWECSNSYKEFRVSLYLHCSQIRHAWCSNLSSLSLQLVNIRWKFTKQLYLQIGELWFLQILNTVVLVNLIKCLQNIRFFLTTYRFLILITLISDLYWVYHLTTGSSRSFGAAMCLCCKAGLLASLSARASVLAAETPVGGH